VSEASHIRALHHNPTRRVKDLGITRYLLDSCSPPGFEPGMEVLQPPSAHLFRATELKVKANADFCTSTDTITTLTGAFSEVQAVNFLHRRLLL
jgi:hypothetical protein